MDALQMERSFSEMLDALSNIQRRRLMVALLEHNPQDDSPINTADDEDEEYTAEDLLAMNHVHLPKLAEYGFIKWDKEHSEVSKREAFDEIRPLLEVLDAHQEELPADWL